MAFVCIAYRNDCIDVEYNVAQLHHMLPKLHKRFIYKSFRVMYEEAVKVHYIDYLRYIKLSIL